MAGTKFNATGVGVFVMSGTSAAAEPASMIALGLD